jgi:hypothetical protein
MRKTGQTAKLHRIASDYARRLHFNPKIALTVPEEWDFRSVTEDQLNVAIYYEYARESQLVRDNILKWLNTKWGDRIVRRWLTTKPDNRPDDLYVGCPLPLSQQVELDEIIAFFPLPFLKIPKRNSVGKYEQIGLRIEKITPHHIKYWSGLLKCGVPLSETNWFLHADLGAQHNEKFLVASFERQLIQLRRKLGMRRRRGKASAQPWQKLRQLAAYRLHRAGLRFSAAQKFVADHQKNLPSDNPADVLPTYKSSGAWSKAVASAKEGLASIH